MILCDKIFARNFSRKSFLGFCRSLLKYLPSLPRYQQVLHINKKLEDCHIFGRVSRRRILKALMTDLTYYHTRYGNLTPSLHFLNYFSFFTERKRVLRGLLFKKKKPRTSERCGGSEGNVFVTEIKKLTNFTAHNKPEKTNINIGQLSVFTISFS